jgi:hypothetical protein
LNGVSGAELLLLHRDQDMRRDLRKMCFHLITKVTDYDDNVFGLYLGCRCHRVTQHGMTSDLVQQLGT